MESCASADADGDGYTDSETIVVSRDPDCADEEEGSASVPDGDCDDGDTAFNPGATEDDCTDPNDYNCDGSVGYEDADSDGFAACEECDDNNRDINPAAVERCDDANVDEDCDGVADDADDSVDSATFQTWYADADQDGYGDADTPVQACDEDASRVDNDLDCDDSDADTYPGAPEVDDDGIDQDCSGADGTGTSDDLASGGSGGSSGSGGSGGKGSGCSTVSSRSAAPGGLLGYLSMIGLLGWRRRR